eukprot:scaffold2448_cov155-Amphora_coffeaeformis.AAC.9
MAVVFVVVFVGAVNAVFSSCKNQIRTSSLFGVPKYELSDYVRISRRSRARYGKRRVRILISCVGWRQGSRLTLKTTLCQAVESVLPEPNGTIDVLPLSKIAEGTECHGWTGPFFSCLEILRSRAFRFDVVAIVV